MGLTLFRAFRAASTLTYSRPKDPPHAKPLTPLRLELLLKQCPASREEQLEHTWNPQDCSRNVCVHPDDPLTACRKPTENSSDCVRGKKSYASGLHAWEVVWPQKQRGSHAVVGVATAAASLHAGSYTALVGSNAESWGWDLSSNQLRHHGFSKTLGGYGMNCLAPDSFLLVLDADRGCLGFVVDGEYLGDAFCGLQGKALYPIISSVWGDCAVTLRYIGSMQRQPLLTELCRRTIQQTMGNRQTEDALESLPLPRQLQIFLRQ